MVVIGNPEMAKTVLSGNHLTYPKGKMYNSLKFLLGKIMIWSNFMLILYNFINNVHGSHNNISNYI